VRTSNGESQTAAKGGEDCVKKNLKKKKGVTSTRQILKCKIDKPKVVEKGGEMP
jgi:hypothetical protein